MSPREDSHEQLAVRSRRCRPDAERDAFFEALAKRHLLRALSESDSQANDGTDSTTDRAAVSTSKQSSHATTDAASD